MPPAAYFFWLVRSGNVQPLFLCAAKKKPLAVKRKRQRGSFESPPLQTPLKRPRRGLRPPSLDFPRGLVCAEIDSDLQNAMQMRIGQTGEVIEILCGEIGRTGASAPTSRLILGIPQISYVKYSTGANKAICTVRRALGRPDQTAARRAFLAGGIIIEWHAEEKCFSRRVSAISYPSVSFLHTFF